MPRLILEIPEEVQSALQLPPAEAEKEIMRELALALYRRGTLSSGVARRFAQMTRWDFEDLLAQHRVPRHYSAEDLAEDLGYAGDG